MVRCLRLHRIRYFPISLWLRPGGLRAGPGPRFSLFSRADLTALEPRPGRGLARTPFPLLEAGDAPTPCEARQAGGLPGRPLPEGCRRPAPRRAPAAASPCARRAPWQPPGPRRERRVTHSAVASAGMRSAGPSVRSPRPEQLTRQAAPGAGPQRQGGAHGPQPRPGTPASAPSHRPRPKASARRAGAAGGIVRAAQAWPRPGPEAPSPPGLGGLGSGWARARHGWAREGDLAAAAACLPARRPLGTLARLWVHGLPLTRWRCSAGRPPAPPPPPGAARGGGPLRPRPLLGPVGRGEGRAPGRSAPRLRLSFCSVGAGGAGLDGRGAWSSSLRPKQWAGPRALLPRERRPRSALLPLHAACAPPRPHSAPEQSQH